MILFALACEHGHRYDSWFASGAAFEALATQGALACPTCGSPHVAKTIMAPAVVTREPQAPARQDAPRTSGDAAGGAGVDRPAIADVALLDGQRRELRSMIKAFREKILAETQDVGSRFPDEARRMHDGEIPRREIRGQATIGEARSLLEDGIFVMPVPQMPEDMN